MHGVDRQVQNFTYYSFGWTIQTMNQLVSLNLKIAFALTATLTVWPLYGNQPNSIALFFETAERQIETQSQCRELKKALDDVLAQSTKILRAKRYRDYQNKKVRWTVVEIIRKHFVSTQSLSEPGFYRDFQNLDAKKAIATALANIPNCDQYGPK